MMKNIDKKISQKGFDFNGDGFYEANSEARPHLKKAKSKLVRQRLKKFLKQEVDFNKNLCYN